MSSDHDASVRRKILRTYSRKNIPTPPANPNVIISTEDTDGRQSYTTQAWAMRPARDPAAKTTCIPRSMTDSAVGRDPRIASSLGRRDPHLPTDFAPSLAEPSCTHEGQEKRSNNAQHGTSSKPERQASTRKEVPVDVTPKPSSNNEETAGIAPFVKMEDKDLDMFPTAVEAPGRFQIASHLHPNISLEDFKEPSVPAFYSNTISPTAQHLGLQPRDGFNNMEGVELTKLASSKRRRKERTIPGMGQLTCVEGFKESPKRRKCRRQMPIIDPDLLAAPTPADDVHERRNHTKVPSQSNEDTFTDCTSTALTSYESRQPDVLPSVEYPEIPATPLSTPRTRQPLMFDRKFEDSLASGRVTLQLPTDDGADLLSEKRARLHGGVPKATSWSGPRDDEKLTGSSCKVSDETRGQSTGTSLPFDRSTPKTCDEWLAD